MAGGGRQQWSSLTADSGAGGAQRAQEQGSGAGRPRPDSPRGSRGPPLQTGPPGCPVQWEAAD